MVRSLSVTADLIFLAIELGSASRPTPPACEEDDLLIFEVGSCRSQILPVDATMYGSGTRRVGPNRPLNRWARSRVSSRCWRWSSPTGTWSASYSRMSAACRTGYVNRPTEDRSEPC